MRDSKGNFWGAISGIGVGGAGKYFGWSFKVTPKGEYIPWSSGLRSPNGLGLTPDDELFVTDNQGEYMGSLLTAFLESMGSRVRPDGDDLMLGGDVYAGGLGNAVRANDDQFPPDFRLSKRGRAKPAPSATNDGKGDGA